jgi:MATE family multidrug resistance protein
VLNLAGFVFMVPFGLGSAAAVRVGHAVGRRDAMRARQAGWVAIALAVGFSLATSVIFVVVPGPFLRIFTADQTVLTTSALVLLIYACSQPFDACQTVATGALRGLGDTRVPMVVNLLGHWGIGLPLACLLCFTRGWGVAGLWTGLSLSLVLIGATLLAAWSVSSRKLRLS